MTDDTWSEDTRTLLTDLECWELLAARHFGRLAYHLIDEVHLVPINYLAEPDRSRLLFRTAQGSKLLGVAMHHDVAFEIDHVGDNSAWSVVARGRAVQLDERPPARPSSCPSAPGCLTRSPPWLPSRSTRSPAAATICVRAAADITPIEGLTPLYRRG